MAVGQYPVSIVNNPQMTKLIELLGSELYYSVFGWLAKTNSHIWLVISYNHPKVCLSIKPQPNHVPKCRCQSRPGSQPQFQKTSDCRKSHASWNCAQRAPPSVGDLQPRHQVVDGNWVSKWSIIVYNG